MNFQVPQFIEIEDKIFGPLTFKQFLYIAGALGLAFILWVYIPVRFIAILIILPVVIFGLALAFYKINNRPFIYLVEAALRYFIGTKLYIWKKKEILKTPKEKVLPSSLGNKNIVVPAPKLSQSRLRDLSWSLDVQEKIK